MCQKVTTTYLLCQHKHQTTDRCLRAVNHERLKFQSRPSLLTRLLCGRTTPPPPRCIPVALTRTSESYCEYCLANQRRLPASQLQHRNPSAHSSRASEANTTRAEARILAAKSRAERRREFKCTLCRFEDRPISPEARNANGGFCCARGIDEFEAAEERRDRSRYQGPENGLPKLRRSENVASLRRGATFGAEKGRDGPRKELVLGRSVTSDIREAREAASRAAKKYGWSREGGEDDVIDARAVREMVNIPGADTSAAGDVKKPLPPLPFLEPPFASTAREKFGYDELGIDWSRWRESPQTAYGRYPRLDSAPQGPLPTPPASRRRPYLAETTPESILMPSLRRRAASNNLKERTRRSRFRVSPLGSPIRAGEKLSPVSPVNTSRFEKLERECGLLHVNSQNSERLTAWRNGGNERGEEKT